MSRNRHDDDPLARSGRGGGSGSGPLFDEPANPGVDYEEGPPPEVDAKLDPQGHGGGAMAVVPPGAGKLTSTAARREWLAKIVPAEVQADLEKAYGMFFGALAAQDQTPTERLLLTSTAKNELTRVLDGPILDNVIAPLAGDPMGFKVDRHPSRPVLLQCSVQAMLSGLPFVGNCWNIIAESMYPTKEGFELLVGQLAKFTVNVTVPPLSQNLFNQGGYVTCTTSVVWKLHSDPEEVESTETKGSFNVRLNKKNAVGVEALQGKATRKALAQVYRIITGVALNEGDVSEAMVLQEGSHYGDEAPSDSSASAAANGAGQ